MTLGADESRRHEHLVSVLNGVDTFSVILVSIENDIAWHSDTRFEVATAIARDLLTGPHADANEMMLYEQAAVWNEIRLDLAITNEDGTGSNLREKYTNGLSSYDWTGCAESLHELWRQLDWPALEQEVFEFFERDDGGKVEGLSGEQEVRIDEAWFGC